MILKDNVKHTEYYGNLSEVYVEYNNKLAWLYLSLYRECQKVCKWYNVNITKEEENENLIELEY